MTEIIPTLEPMNHNLIYCPMNKKYTSLCLLAFFPMKVPQINQSSFLSTIELHSLRSSSDVFFEQDIKYFFPV